MLVLLDAERPIKYPLYKETMTIGRADIADIQIDNGFLSRLHARVVSTPEGVTIEDVESKNGIRVNAKLTPRQDAAPRRRHRSRPTALPLHRYREPTTPTSARRDYFGRPW